MKAIQKHLVLFIILNIGMFLDFYFNLEVIQYTFLSNFNLIMVL